MLTFSQLAHNYGIALSGGAATGKSTVSSMLRDIGHTVIDADALARQAVAPDSPGLTAVVEKFGAHILNEDRSLNRNRLRELIFNDEKKRKVLEDILHPRIHQLLQNELHRGGFFTDPRLWFYEAALLVETGTYHNFKQLWITHCSPQTQVARLMARDKLSQKQATAVIAAQLPTSVKLAKADLCIYTENNHKAIKALITQHLATTAVTTNT